MKLCLRLLTVFVIFTICHAVPVPKKGATETDLSRKEFDAQPGDSNNRQAARNGRQSGFYDYFAYPSEYYQQPYYPDYYGSRRPNINSSPIGYPNAYYPSRRKHDQRRKNVEASTQRWTVWDLARK